MTTLLIRATLILAGSELLVMALLSRVELSKPLAVALDPLLMVAIAIWPLYLLMRKERRRLEKQEALDAKLHGIVDNLWNASMNTLSRDAFLAAVLRELLDTSAIPLQRKGAIFLQENGEFRLKAEVGFSEAERQSCSAIQSGRCLCGAVIESRRPVYASDVDDRRHVRTGGGRPHGHYCFPILSGNDLFGVLTLYLDPGHRRDPAEERFISSVCAIVARIVEAKRLESSLRQMQKVEALNRFAAGISHDFNNILSAIRGYCDVALRGLPGPSQAAGDIRDIISVVDRGALLTRQLKLYSRQWPEEYSVEDLNLVVKESSEMIRHLSGAGIKVSLKPYSEPLPVRCNRGQLEQVLLNLASNARDAMPGGGEFRLETSCREVGFPGKKRSMTAAVIAASDTGSGIPQELAEKIFEPFFTTKPEGAGTGLGLAMAHSIISQHGGEITVSSSQTGTRFDIYLPLRGGSEEPEVLEKDL
ncbi:MAG: ATP-binding protein [Elusimicrobia bacterium]|nr:ATP-binding protein [Elusimicrobiota bacterium]